MNYEFFMRKALDEAERALAEGEFPVGCVLAYQNKVIAAGRRRYSWGEFRNEIDHAEMVALRRLSQIPLEMDSSKLTIFCTMEPCLMCLGAIILSGIREIVFAYEDVMGGATSCDLTKLSPLYKNSRITVIENILRAESLKIFKTYFSDPIHTYWQDSLLARYTLNQ
jgi:tRNA(adenine34) deaminase